MKLSPGMEKLGIGVLGVVSLFLAANLVLQYRVMQPGISHAPRATASASPRRVGKASSKASSHVADDLAQFDPDIHFAALSAQDSRPLPDEDRNPFEFVGGAPAPTVQAPVVAAQAAPPPAPPPLPVKAVGYNELPGGGKEAMVTFNDDLLVVHEGDLVGTKYKVVKINPTMVTIEDSDTHQTLELPFPQ